MNILNDYKLIEESTESLFSILIYDKKIGEIIKFVEDQLDKAKNISNPIKKSKVNNRLFSFLKYLKENYESIENYILNSIFLLNDKVFEYKLSCSDIKIAHEYSFQKVYFKSDIKFHINYFIDFFCNFDFIYTIKVNKNELSIIKLNKNKEKELEKLKLNNENNIVESIDIIRRNYNYNDYIIIYGNNQILNKLNNIKNVVIKKELINREDVQILYENESMKKNIIELERRLNDIKNVNTNIDLYIFGKLKVEIKDAIEAYSIKELYIENKKLDKLKEFVDNDLLNFKIIPIKSLEIGDSADTFIKDYNGIMGIKYF
jgi:hypothetical protein